MKKIVSLLTIAALATACIFAKPAKSTIGLQGSFGESLGSAFADSTRDENPKAFGDNLLFGGALTYAYNINSNFSVQCELDVLSNSVGYQTSSGITLWGNTTTYTTDNTYSYTSLDFPLLAVLRYKEFAFEAGPYVSFPLTELTLGSTSVTTTSSSTSTSNSSSTVGKLNTANFGLLFGGAYEPKMGPGKLCLDVRYLIDLTPSTIVTTDSEGNETKTEYFTRRGLLLSLGYKVNF